MKVIAATKLILLAALLGCAVAQWNPDVKFRPPGETNPYQNGNNNGGQDKEPTKPTPQQKFTQLIDNVQSTIGVLQSGVGLASSIINMFGSTSSETLSQALTNRGYEHFKSSTSIRSMTMAGEIYEEYTRREILRLTNVPKKHLGNVKRLVREAGMVDSNSWQDTQAVFDIGKGGENSVIQVLTAKDMSCNRMSVVIITSKNTFRLKPNLFIITKTKARMGGAFSNTKLVWKTEKAGLSTTDLEFVSKYFLGIALEQLQSSSQSLLRTQASTNCGPYRPLPKQCNPWQKDPRKSDYCGGSPQRYSGGSRNKRPKQHKRKHKGKKKKHSSKKRKYRSKKSRKLRGVFPTTHRYHLHVGCDMVTGCRYPRKCRPVYTHYTDCCGTCPP